MQRGSFGAPDRQVVGGDDAVGAAAGLAAVQQRPAVTGRWDRVFEAFRAGANGVKVRHGAVWATNLDKGTLLRIPLQHGRPGPVQVKASNLVGIDDFAFIGDSDGDVLATLNAPNTVVRIAGDGTATTVLTSADGLQNPTSVAVRGTTAYVLSAAYTTADDPNLVLVTLSRR